MSVARVALMLQLPALRIVTTPDTESTVHDPSALKAIVPVPVPPVALATGCVEVP